VPSTYTANKLYEQQATGENDGTWGTVLNAVLAQIDLNMGGRQAKTAAGSNITLTDDEAENIFQYITGTLSGNIDYIFPASGGGFWAIYNNTSGAFTITVKPSGGTGVTVPQGLVTWIFINPTLTSAFVIGYTTPTTTRGDMIYRGPSADTRLAVGTSGQALISNGTDPLWGAINLASAAAVTGALPSANIAATLTSKRITPRIGTTASSATPTPNGDANDQYNVTALATGATFAAPSGTPTDGQKLIIRIKDNGTARSLAWNAIYQDSADLPLPSTTVISQTMYLGFIYNSAATKWDLVAFLDNIS